MEVASVLVWGGIMLGSRYRPSHLRRRIQSTGPVVVTRFFFHMSRLFESAMGLQFLFMDDNAPCHRTVVAEQLLKRIFLDTDGGSSYLTTSNDSGGLRLALQDEWAAMPQQLIDTLILSMGRRCETYLAVREIISPTKRPDVSCWTPITGIKHSIASKGSMRRKRFGRPPGFLMRYKGCDCRGDYGCKIRHIDVLCVYSWVRVLVSLKIQPCSETNAMRHDLSRLQAPSEGRGVEVFENRCHLAGLKFSSLYTHKYLKVSDYLR
ncbi:hypothetical protein TNCV_249361 [Trichonephila clavipes]|nr:hypothetical protein TNCV_249361 [Trichonephila clavipes]